MKQGSWWIYRGDDEKYRQQKKKMSLSQNRGKTFQYLIVHVENDVQNVSTIGWFLGGHKFLTLHFSLSWNWIGSRASLMLAESGPKKSVQQE